MRKIDKEPLETIIDMYPISQRHKESKYTGDSLPPLRSENLYWEKVLGI